MPAVQSADSGYPQLGKLPDEEFEPFLDDGYIGAQHRFQPPDEVIGRTACRGIHMEHLGYAEDGKQEHGHDQDEDGDDAFPP